jgi:hypothetical protein
VDEIMFRVNIKQPTKVDLLVSLVLELPIRPWSHFDKQYTASVLKELLGKDFDRLYDKRDAV